MSEYPKNEGLCTTCEDKDNCPMTEMVSKWQELLAKHGEDIKELRPDLWDEYSIEEPDVNNGEITWCPMYHQPKGELGKKKK